MFLSWSDGNTTSNRTITLSTNTTNLYANFGKLATITGVVSPTDAGTITGAGTFLTGNTQYISAVTNTGWRFIQWDNTLTNNTLAITVTTNQTVTAIFKHEVQLLVSANPTIGGTVTGSGLGIEGDSRSISATPNNGYMFLSWSDGNTTSNRTITLATNTTSLSANFGKLATITANLNHPEAGTIQGTGTYLIGSIQTLTIKPNIGWKFTKWNDNQKDNPRTITINETNTTFLANIEKLPTITITPATIVINPNEHITISATTETTPLNYKWLIANIPIPNQTNKTLILSNLTYEDATKQLTCIITTELGEFQSEILNWTIRPTINITHTNSTTEITVNGIRTKTYTIETSQDLKNWEVFTTGTKPNLKLDQYPTTGLKFYRAIEEKPQAQ